MFHIGTSKAVFRDFPDAAILHVGTEQDRQHSANLGLALAALALNDHHPLSFITGNQTVTDKLLQGGDVLEIEQPIQK